ncbi:MAG: carbonic anhydrase [Pseudomonadota bacterium]
MENYYRKGLEGYQRFREKYAQGDYTVMQFLSDYGQKPQLMVVSCCDSRVDPALILQCDPGDLFVVRNVANIIPPYEKDIAHHGTSAALEFGICGLEIEDLILLGHSQCGGINALLTGDAGVQNDFITNWVSLVDMPDSDVKDPDEYARLALHKSLQNCLTFPWIKARVEQKKLTIHLWFFDVKEGQIYTYSDEHQVFQPL